MQITMKSGSLVKLYNFTNLVGSTSSRTKNKHLIQEPLLHVRQNRTPSFGLFTLAGNDCLSLFYYCELLG